MAISSWWRETARLYLRYMAAVAASVPVALLYAYLATKKLDSWWSTTALIALGLGSTVIGWRFSERLFISEQRPRLEEVCVDTNYGIQVGLAAVIVATSIVAPSFGALCSGPASLDRRYLLNMSDDAQVQSASATPLASVNAEI